jgi:DNA polymerase-3 subunit alpha
MSWETGIPVVATNDAHYIEKKDAEIQDVLLCIQTNKTIDDSDRMRFETEEFYIKSAEEMASLFPDTPEALSNTVKIASICDVSFEFQGYIQPEYPLPRGVKSSDEYLRDESEKGFLRRYGENAPREYRERLEYELGVITQMGYSDYYLIVADYVNFAKKSGIPVGPGRGSGAGSIVAYCLGITNICPMKYSLIFERFLNPDRISMPDFDVDFCPKRRGEVIFYMVSKYGADRVTQIITFGTMAARAAIRDAGRVLNMPYAQVDSISKLVPAQLHITIDKALEKSPDLMELYEKDPAVKKLIDIAKGLEGMPRNASTHAAGVVVTPLPTYEYVPLAKNDDVVVTQFPMTTIMNLGLVKMDFLGLRNLTIIDDAVKLIKKREPDFDLDRIPDDDEATYNMLAEGKTSGVFQLESAGMKSVAVGLKAQSIEEIAACIALYRPGPMEQIPKFIDCKFDSSHVKYRHPLLRKILGVTYGCAIYQEQVMEIFKVLAGYSMGRADIVRSAISKKKVEVLEKERNNFIYGNPGENIPGCIANGVSETDAEQIFEEILDFGGYAFNKAHAAAYALVSYQTAYLKCRYPGEYMGALLSSVLDFTPKVASYIAECKSMGISVLPPDVNSSEDGFTVEGNNIRFGLVAVKNVGLKLIQDLVNERETNGKFKSFADFCRRMSAYDFNRRAAESLIRCGACDCFNLYRSQMLAMFESIIESAQAERKRMLEGQLGLFGEEECGFDEPEPPALEEFSRRERLAMEKETTGIYLSGHPIDEYIRFFDSAGTIPLGEIVGEESYENEGDAPNISYDGKNVTVGGIVTSVKQKSTRNGQMMAFVTIEDLTSAIELIVFPKVLAAYGGYLRQDNVVIVKGRVSLREGEEPKIICEDCALAKAGENNDGNPEKLVHSVITPPGNGQKVYLRIYDESEALLKRLRGLFVMFPGDMQVILHFPAAKRTLSAGPGYTVCPDERLFKELNRLLGDNNIVVK